MSIASVTNRHTVSVFVKSSTVGSSLGVKEEYVSDLRTLTCTVVPQFKGSTFEREMLMQQGAVQTYTIYLSSNPWLDERYMLVWDSTKIRVTGIPRNCHGQDRMWIVLGEALAIDNVGVTIK